MDIKEIFEASGKSTWHVLCETGVGYYIPSYQREYSWGKENITRLFEDTIHGLRLLVNSDDSITFIGTLIAIHDSKCQTIDPIVKHDMPKSVMLIIDGQQRIVTLLLLNTKLHQKLKLESQRFSKDDSPAFLWLYNTALEVCSQLETTFQQDMVHGKGLNRWYPRMIRSIDDSWSRDPKLAKYTSPIARYLHKYIIQVQENPFERFEYVLPEGSEAVKSKHKIIQDNSRFITKKLNSLTNGSDPDIDFPSIDDIISSKTLQETLFKNELSEEVRTVLLDKSKDKKVERFKSLFSTIILAKYILERVAVTVVTAKNEDYAFDMFEALNTTGEPLTAFETFKPRVIQAEGLVDYDSSQSRDSLFFVEEYLETYTKAQEKQKATSNLLIPFSLAENGHKLSKRLSDQRRYLKESYDKLPNIDEKRYYVKHLSDVALFIKNSWPDRSSDRPCIPGVDSSDVDLELVCLDVLRNSGHDITIAPLVRFFSSLRNKTPYPDPILLDEYKLSIRAITAFSALWRGSRRTTDKIDSYYRKLMEVGFENVGIPPLSREPLNKPKFTPKSERLRSAFRYILGEFGGIKNKEDWIRASWNNPIYSINNSFCKFLLLASVQDTYPDKEHPGLVKKGKEGLVDVINLKRYYGLTVEHIAPRNPDGSWSEKIYEDPDIIHCFGNLTLLPNICNIIASNNDWETKKLIYELLSESSLSEHQQKLQEAKKCGIDLTDRSQEILSESKYLPHVNSIANIGGNWEYEHIEKRSKRTAELIWDTLAPWLELEKD